MVAYNDANGRNANTSNVVMQNQVLSTTRYLKGCVSKTLSLAGPIAKLRRAFRPLAPRTTLKKFPALPAVGTFFKPSSTREVANAEGQQSKEETRPTVSAEPTQAAVGCTLLTQSCRECATCLAAFHLFQSIVCFQGTIHDLSTMRLTEAEMVSRN